MATTNTIPAGLQLTKVMNSTMRALKRRLLPLMKLSTVFRDVPLQGNDTMALPFYPLASTGSSATRAAAGSRKALASNTTTDLRIIDNFTNKVQALSFTATERARQPMFDPVMHGTLKGEALAYDILADIFGVVEAKSFTGETIPVVTAANFDEDEVADLRKLCSEAYWPEMGRTLVLNPAYGCNLLKQAQIIAADQRGDGGNTFRDGVIGRVLGFDVVETAGLLDNNAPAFAVLGAATGDLFTAVAHGFAVGDRIRFPAIVGGTGLTAATVVYYVKTVPTADTFTISETLGGATKTFSADATSGTTVQRYENVQGIAVLPSALLVGFAPVPPTPAIKKELYDYQQLVDKETGLTLQFYHFADPDTDEEIQTIECHYGFAIGDTAQLKIIRSL